MINMLSILIIVVISLAVSAFFSGMEIAFLSSNKLKLEIDKKQNRVFNFIAGLFSRYPGQYITTMLVGNNIVLVIYSLYMSMLIKNLLGVGGEEFLGDATLLVETIISTVVIIFAGEFIPKTVVRFNPNFYYRIFAVPIYIIYIVLYPIAKFSTLLSALILRICGIKKDQSSRINVFDRNDLASLIDESSDVENENETDKDIKLFQNALDFSDLTVRDCMVQRIDIEAVDTDCTIPELTERFTDTNFSRLLVYEGNIDNVIGYVNTKSLFREPSSIKDIIKPIDYVTESMLAQKLLTVFIKKHHSVAVVIDEFGGTAGMVTIEDVLEEIFGEIEDEHDSHDNVDKKISDNEFLLSGRLEVDYLNEKYGLDIPESEDYDTLAGYVIFNYQGIPAAGETIEIDDKKIKVLRSTSSKLELVRLTIT